MRPSRVGLVLISLLVAAGLSACSVSFGGSDKIDHKKAEKLLLDNIKPPPKSVTCPSDVKIVKGGTFTCTIVTADGKHGTVTMHMTDSKGHVEATNKDIHIRG